MATSRNRILVTGAAGFIGQELVAPLLASSPDIQLTITDVVKPPIPAAATADSHRISAIQADLTDPATVAELLKDRFSAVYILHGLMSGGSEADLELGLRINLDSVRGVFDYLRRSHPGTVVVFTSSCAIYGPEPLVKDAITLPQPQTSYGTEKFMCELLLNDYSRRGLLDGRIVRLPTVVVRPGKPSAAASSFASGIVRESLQGIENVLPVARDLEVWVCSPATVVKNLAKIKSIPKEQFGDLRSVNLPGITVTVQDILDALEKVGGRKALGFIREEADPAIVDIVKTWSTRFDVSRALAMGLEPDGELIEAVEAFARTLKSQ